MTKEIWIQYKGKYIKNPSKWIMFKWNLRNWFTKWKIIDKTCYKLIPIDELDRWFSLSFKEYKEADRLYKEEHRTLSYEFYPCAGIGWGIRVHDLDTEEIFDITSYDNW